MHFVLNIVIGECMLYLLNVVLDGVCVKCVAVKYVLGW